MYKIVLHFTCAGPRVKEVNFRKMSVSNKWSCVNNCKDDIIISATNAEISRGKKLSLENLTQLDKLLLELKDSVKFMSEQFDDFNMQLPDIIKSIKEIKEENKQVQEQNQNLKNEINVVNKKMNLIE